MCVSQTLGLIAVLVIVAREFIISGFRLVASDAGIVIAASMWGKFKTATTMIAICLMIVVKELPFLKDVTMVLFWVAVTLTIVSLVDYIVKNIHVLSDAFTKTKKEEPVAAAPTEMTDNNEQNENV